MVATMITKYNSVIATLVRPMPTWVTDPDDQVRVAAYDAYDDMFKNVPNTFAVIMRGEEDSPIYVPSARKIIEATNRYLAKSWSWTVQAASENDRMALQAAMFHLFIREEMAAKFYSLKRTFLKKGDGLFHITFDGKSEPGSRISISELDPRHYFPIPSLTNSDKTTGCYIVNLLWADDGRTQIAQRLEYRKTETGAIRTQMTFWETDGWDDRWVGHPALKPADVPEAFATDKGMQPLLAGFELPSSVTAVPVYHMRNNREGNDPFGGSEIAGLETLIAGINQAISDEDITLALQGLGVYKTTSTRPKTSDGEEADWVIVPGYVIELNANETFDRVEGVKSVVPYQEHLGYLGKSIDETAGLSAVAVGNVSVQSAQSGVALRLEMAPILAKNEEKETELLAKLDHFMHDLAFMWLPVDGFTPSQDAVIINSFGDPLPVDRAGVVKEAIDLVTNGLMSRKFAIAWLTAKLGFQFPADMLDDIISDQDAFAERLWSEETGGGANVRTPDPSGVGDISSGGASVPGNTGTTTGPAPTGRPANPISTPVPPAA
jgi:hypothetical protein